MEGIALKYMSGHGNEVCDINVSHASCDLIMSPFHFQTFSVMQCFPLAIPNDFIFLKPMEYCVVLY